MDFFEKLKMLTIKPEPDVWVSRMVIFERISPKPVTVRDITLSRGLNIVWAEETEDDDPVAEITGHSAGKTTFCRLLRYILGEKTFGTKNGMDLIHQAFPNGYVAAELQVLGKSWAIRRPFGGGRMSFIMPEATIEQLIDDHGNSVSQENYVKELGFDGLIDRLESGGIARTGEIIHWGHVLAWCTRDQETRFQSLYEWRSPRSESEAPSFRFPKIGPLFVIRAVLGLFLPSELNSEEMLAGLLKQREEFTKEIEEKKREPFFRVNLYEQELRSCLRKLLPTINDLHDRPFSSTDMFTDDLTRLTSKASKQLKDNIEKLEKKERQQQDMLENFGVRILQYRREREELEAFFTLNCQAAKEVSSGILQQTEQQQELKQKLNAICGLGDVLVKECMHVKKRQQILQLTNIHDAHALKQDGKKQEQEYRRIKNELKRLDKLIEQSSDKRQKTIKKRDEIRTECREKQEQLRSLQNAHDHLKAWIGKCDNNHGEYEQIDLLRNKLEELEQAIIEIESELTLLLARHNKNRELLTSIFSTAVRSVLLSGTYDGEVRFKNRELNFCITRGQAMTGEAVETLAVLLADISCLIYNAQAETSRFPGFLLHDSPREADLGKRLYYSFIRFIAKLQDQFDKDRCPFQYILTTTTAPPKELQSAKYVKLHLNAAKSGELLFRSNFMTSRRQQSLLDLQGG